MLMVSLVKNTLPVLNGAPGLNILPAKGAIIPKGCRTAANTGGTGSDRAGQSLPPAYGGTSVKGRRATAPQLIKTPAGLGLLVVIMLCKLAGRKKRFAGASIMHRPGIEAGGPALAV